MEWIRVAPKTMPPVDVAIHIAIKKDEQTVTGMFASVFHDGEFFGVATAIDGVEIELHRINEEVTHWAMWPDPPQSAPWLS